MKQVEQMEQPKKDSETTLLARAFKGIWRISDIILLVSLPFLLIGEGLGIMALLDAAPFPNFLWGLFAVLTALTSLLLLFRCAIRLLGFVSTGVLDSKEFTLTAGYAVFCLIFLVVMIVFGIGLMASNLWGGPAIMVILGCGVVAFFESQLAQQGKYT